MKKTAVITIGSCSDVGFWTDSIRRLGTLAARIAISACLVVFFTGCKKMVPVSKSDYGSLEQKGKAEIITTTGKEYEYHGFRMTAKMFLDSVGRSSDPSLSSYRQSKSPSPRSRH